MITIEDIKKDYRLGKTIVPALKGINLKIKKGEFMTLAGPSGSGKTTLLNLIGSIDEPTSGSIFIEDMDINKLSLSKKALFRNKKIGFIFQTFNLIPVLNIYENIELPLLLVKKNLSGDQKKSWINHLVESVGLTEYLKHKPDELSGGQRQRVAIARALVNKPDIVLADEPTANLDSETGIMITKLMKRMNKDEGITFLFSTHDPEIMKVSERIIKIRDGIIM